MRPLKWTGSTPTTSTFIRRSHPTSIGTRKPQWQQTMLRISDPSVTVPFYRDHFGMHLIHQYHFDEMGFSLYFMGSPLENTVYPEAGTKDSERFLWEYPGVALEFTHNHDASNTVPMSNGNVEPYRGFGHIAMNTDDVKASYEQLAAEGVAFQKTPDGGKMKGLAFALDPDGYWIEICERTLDGPHSAGRGQFNLSQTMLRVKCPQKALEFYCDKMGMTNVCEAHIESGRFSVYFLSSHIERAEVEGKSMDQRRAMMKQSFHPFLELTHNWGTETHPPFRYHSGNEEPKGFGHTGFLLDDLGSFCKGLQAQNVSFKKLPEDGKMRGIAFAIDPDGYWVELVQRGVTF